MSPEEIIERDSKLIAGVLSGDEQSFRSLLTHYQSAVFACTMAITRHSDDASDAAQEAFIRFYKNIDQFDSSRPLKPYIMRIAANCSRNLIAKKLRQERLLEEDLTLSASAASPQLALIKGERNQAIRKLVDQLPGTLREVTSLFYLADCSCKEVAEILEMTESAVKVALHRSRKRLFNDMQEWRMA